MERLLSYDLPISQSSNLQSPNQSIIYTTNRYRQSYLSFSVLSRYNPGIMHELPVTQGILSVALEAAEQHGHRRITAVNLVIGDLTSIVDDSVQFYFDAMSEGTLAEGAELRFQREAAAAKCLECGHQYTVTPPLDPFCPQCDSPFLEISGGKEFYVDSIEVDDEDTRG